jgi:hypothetical protein
LGQNTSFCLFFISLLQLLEVNIRLKAESEPAPMSAAPADGIRAQGEGFIRVAFEATSPGAIESMSQEKPQRLLLRRAAGCVER